MLLSRHDECGKYIQRFIQFSCNLRVLFISGYLSSLSFSFHHSTILSPFPWCLSDVAGGINVACLIRYTGNAPMIAASKLIALTCLYFPLWLPLVGHQDGQENDARQLHPFKHFTKQGQAANRGTKTPKDQHSSLLAPPIRIEVAIRPTDLRWFLVGSGGNLEL